MQAGHSIRAAILALAVLFPAAAPAATAVALPGEAHAPAVPDVVFPHVSDAREIEFENPINGDTLVFKLPHWGFDIPADAPILAGKHVDLSPTKHTIFLWVAAGLLVVVMTLTARKRSIVPKGFYSMMEVFVQFVREELAVKNIGKEHADHYVPYLCSIFFFILAANLLGLIPYTATATGNIAVTVALALTSLVMTLVAGMRAQGVVGYWLHLVPGGVPWWLYPIMFPIELLGLFSRPFALTVRLFANMVAGHVVIYFLLGLIFLLGAAGPYVAPVSVGFATGIYLLEIFVAFLQAYIFTMLTALFIGLASHAH